MATMTSSKAEAVALFLAEEAHLLDSGKFHEWLTLFDENGYYWMPVSPTDELRQINPAIFDADKAFLEIILNRLYLDTAYSFLPAPRCCRFVSNIMIIAEDDDGLTVRSKLHYEEYRTLESVQDDHRSLSGTVHHQLVRHGESFRIRSKRIDLIQSEAALGAISAPL